MMNSLWVRPDAEKQQRGFDALDFFVFFIRDENNTIIGGCMVGTLYGSLHIDSFWVNKIIRSNCNFATVNTGKNQVLYFKIFQDL